MGLAFPVGEVPIGIEHGHQMIGQPREHLRGEFTGQHRQVDFGSLPIGCAHARRDLRQRPAGDRQLLGAGAPGGLGGGQLGQQRLQRLTPQRGSRAQLGGLTQPAPHRRGADPQPLG